MSRGSRVHWLEFSVRGLYMGISLFLPNLVPLRQLSTNSCLIFHLASISQSNPQSLFLQSSFSVRPTPSLLLLTKVEVPENCA